MATVFIPSLLRRLTNQQDRVTIPGATLRQIINNLDQAYPGMKTELMADGDIKPGIAVAIDGETNHLGLLERVGENSEVHFIPAIGGGRGPNGMAVDVQTETLIARPLEQVAAFAADPANAPKWYVNIKAAELKTPLPLAQGSKVAFIARFLGRRLAYTYEFVEFVPGERLVMRTAEGPFPMETTYTWQPAANGATRMTLRNRGEPRGFSRLFAPFMALAMRRANRKDLARLKALLEKA